MKSKIVFNFPEFVWFFRSVLTIKLNCFVVLAIVFLKCWLMDFPTDICMASVCRSILLLFLFHFECISHARIICRSKCKPTNANECFICWQTNRITHKKHMDRSEKNQSVKRWKKAMNKKTTRRQRTWRAFWKCLHFNYRSISCLCCLFFSRIFKFSLKRNAIENETNVKKYKKRTTQWSHAKNSHNRNNDWERNIHF